MPEEDETMDNEISETEEVIEDEEELKMQENDNNS